MAAPNFYTLRIDNMPVLYDSTNRTFTLNTDNSTYQMQADKFGYLLHLYYGARTSGLADWGYILADRGFSGSPYGAERTYSLDYLPQEYPTQGTGDFRTPMLIVRDSSGTYGADLRYSGYGIRTGKYALSGLPAVYAAEDEDAETLIITLKNGRLGLDVNLLYGVLPHKDIITRSAIIRNEGQESITVLKLGSSCLDFTHGRFDLITFHGRHAMERQFDRQPLHHGSHIVGSRRGMSSHQYNPFVILADHDATETAGRCWAMQYVYSGGFEAEAELSQYGQTRMIMGLSQEKFAYELAQGEEITAPEVIMTFSNSGLERISHNLHDCIRENVCRGKFRDATRPVVLNSWEGFMMDFDGKKIMEMAESAASLGVEMFVLDDGWFMNRNDDNRALGDWTADEAKLGCSLGELVQKVNALGLKFGLWVEPEMISEDSNLYREHPEWAMIIPGEKPVLGRHQLVLDLSRREVREYIYNSISSILEQGNIEYLKWDYNRSINEVYSYTTPNSKVIYDYMTGLYEVLELLNKNYPDVLIEGCAGGGGRFDAGMLYYTPQIWCSDNTDAIDRLYIHYGTSFGYPSCTIGAHVSICPNQQTGRITPIKTRYVSAMSGAFGYELNPSLLTEDKKQAIKAQIAQYKQDRGIISGGKYYRLNNPHEDNFCAWEYVSRDGVDVLVNAVIILNHGNMPPVYVTPRGLTAGASYMDTETGKIYPADALMCEGLPLTMPKGDYESYTLRFRRL